MYNGNIDKNNYKECKKEKDVIQRLERAVTKKYG